jgi:hypothetical protein
MTRALGRVNDALTRPGITLEAEVTLPIVVTDEHFAHTDEVTVAVTEDGVTVPDRDAQVERLLRAYERERAEART